MLTYHITVIDEIKPKTHQASCVCKWKSAEKADRHQAVVAAWVHRELHK